LATNNAFAEKESRTNGIYYCNSVNLESEGCVDLGDRFIPTK